MGRAAPLIEFLHDCCSVVNVVIRKSLDKVK